MSNKSAALVGAAGMKPRNLGLSAEITAGAIVSAYALSTWSGSCPSSPSRPSSAARSSAGSRDPLSSGTGSSLSLSSAYPSTDLIICSVTPSMPCMAGNLDPQLTAGNSRTLLSSRRLECSAAGVRRHRAAWLSDERRVDDDVAEVRPGREVEGTPAGNQPELGVRHRPVDCFRRKARLRIAAQRCHLEDRERAIRADDVDVLTTSQLAQAIEHPWSEPGVDVPGDDRGADLAWPGAALVPASHRRRRRHLQGVPGRQPQPDQIAADPDRRDEQPERPGDAVSRTLGRTGDAADWSRRSRGITVGAAGDAWA